MVRTGQAGPSVQQDLDDLIVVGVGRQHQGLHVGSEAGLHNIRVIYIFFYNFSLSFPSQTASRQTCD